MKVDFNHLFFHDDSKGYFMVMYTSIFTKKILFFFFSFDGGTKVMVVPMRVDTRTCLSQFGMEINLKVILHSVLRRIVIKLTNETYRLRCKEKTKLPF